MRIVRRVRVWAAYYRHEMAHLLFCPVTYFLDPGIERDIPRWAHPHLFPMILLHHLCNRYERKHGMEP